MIHRRSRSPSAHAITRAARVTPACVALAALGALAACKHAPPVQPQWHYVTTGNNGEKFYVDTTTIRASGDQRSFTLVAVEPKPKISFGVAYDRSTTDDRITCTGGTFILGGVRGYHGDTLVFDNPGESAVPMSPGGPFEAVHRYVCAR